MMYQPHGTVRWTPEEDQQLTMLVIPSTPSDWNELARNFQGKTPQQLAERWGKVLDPSLVKRSWTREEDETILRFVGENGPRYWSRLAGLLPGRIGKQCRERWRKLAGDSSGVQMT